MMQASVYGRVGQDPRSIGTKTGNAMAVASLAVTIGEGENGTLWVGLVAFGKVADDLLRHQKGDLLSAAGRVQRNTWTDKEGKRRDDIQVVADSVISARTVRPSGGRKQDRQPQRGGPSAAATAADLNDDLPF